MKLDIMHRITQKDNKTDMRKIITTMLLVCSMTAFAQSADKLYYEGKKLYDAEKYAEAFPKLKAAAEKGHAKAMYRLGRCYDKGRGTGEDDKQAFEWYKKAADKGNAKAQYQLGKCYKDGESVAKDRKKAFELFMLAAKQENADGQFAVGKAYFKGKGVAADQAQAKKWILRAVRNEKGGSEILAELRQEAKDGDEDSKAMLKLIGK